jgi:hypothetical protein
MLLVSGLLAFIMNHNDADAVPVLIIEELNASWDDTFNDTTGIYDMNGVSVNETRGDVTLEGYWNNFDTEPIGTIAGWGYEYAGAPYHHRVIEDPHEPGRCLHLAMNDNLAAYREHKVWKEFDTYLEILDFHLTPFEMKGTNRQAYFYIEFYNITNDEIHEVRYYWDDTRSGVPASSSTLTAVDLGWAIPTGGPNMGDIRYYLHENISKDIDANPSASIEDLLFNTTTFRYGFYQDAGPNWVQIDQVNIDNLGIHPPINTGNLTSVEIPCPQGLKWKSLIVNKTEPGFDNFINISILDGSTFEVIDTYSNLIDDIIDISSINPADHPTIRLVAFLVGNGSATPVLHNWTVTWIDVISSPTGLSVTNPLTGYSLILSWSPNPESDIAKYILYYSSDNITFHSLANVSAYTFSFTHYSLDLGTTYYYKIAAGDDVPSQSLFSEVVEGTPDRDYDGDGIGDTDDLDDDNDGILDIDDPYPKNPLNYLEETVGNINTTVNDIQDQIIDIQLEIDTMNTTLGDLQADIDYLNQSLWPKIDDLTTQLSGVNDSIMSRISELEINILSDLQSVNASLYFEVQNLLTEITNDILEMMASMEMLEANLTAQHDSINSTLDILSGLVSNEHALTRSEILDMLNNSLDLLQNLDSNMTTHDTDIKNLISALDALIKNENDLTRNQLMDNVSEILNQLQIVDQNILNEIAGMNTSTSAQLMNLMNNMTTEHDALEQWLDIVLDEIEFDLTATNDTLHKQLDDLDAAMTSFFDNLNIDISGIQSDLILHDEKTGENHSDIIDLLDDLLAGQIEKEKIHELRTFLINLAGNISEHNQTIADDIMDVVEDIDQFEVETDEQLERINQTLEDLAKLEEILDDLETLDQSLVQAEEEIQDSVDQRATKEEDEERFVMLELFLIIVLILLVINMILTILTRKKIDSIKDTRAQTEMIKEDREIDTSTPESKEEVTERTPPRPPSTQ